MKYFVLEMQIGDTASTLINSFDSFPQAESSYHTVVASAVLSTVPKHTVVLIDEDGQQYERRSYMHGEQGA